MSLVNEILSKTLSTFEDTHGETFTYRGADYKATAAQETQEQPYDAGGQLYQWRVTIEATLKQFGTNIPQVRDRIIYNGRHYSIRDRELDPTTIKIHASTASE